MWINYWSIPISHKRHKRQRTNERQWHYKRCRCRQIGGGGTAWGEKAQRPTRQEAWGGRDKRWRCFNAAEVPAEQGEGVIWGVTSLWALVDEHLPFCLRCAKKLCRANAKKAFPYLGGRKSQITNLQLRLTNANEIWKCSIISQILFWSLFPNTTIQQEVN